MAAPAPQLLCTALITQPGKQLLAGIRIALEGLDLSVNTGPGKKEELGYGKITIRYMECLGKESELARALKNGNIDIALISE